MGTYEFKRKRCAFQISLPDDFRSLQRESIARLRDAVRTSYYRSFAGSNGEYLVIKINPLSKKWPEPTIEQISRSLDDWAYDYNQYVIAKGIVNIADKKHFWGMYPQKNRYRTNVIKKYCLHLNKVQYVLAAKIYSEGTYSHPCNRVLHNDQRLQDRQIVYDQIALSFRLL